MTAGETKRAAHTTTLRQQDGSLTKDLQGTLTLMIQKFSTEHNQEDDNDNHRQTRNLISKPMDTDDDVEFTELEFTNVIQYMINKKAPVEDGITNEVWKGVTKILPKYITAIYNKCLKEVFFPRRWKTAKIIPIVKPGKEGSDEVNNFRPISLLASGSNVLENLLTINHVYTRGYTNENQFGFRPQKSTVDKAMATRDFVQKKLRRRSGSAGRPGRKKSVRCGVVARDIERSEGILLSQESLHPN
jgi:hypothetical protein